MVVPLGSPISSSSSSASSSPFPMGGDGRGEARRVSGGVAGTKRATDAVSQLRYPSTRHPRERSINGRTWPQAKTSKTISYYQLELEWLYPHLSKSSNKRVISNIQILSTSKGPVMLELYKEAAPEVVERFLDLWLPTKLNCTRRLSHIQFPVKFLKQQMLSVGLILQCGFLQLKALLYCFKAYHPQVRL